MALLIALFLGALQGLTEFLPISSSGHLMLFERIFGLNSGGLFFNVLVHFATLMAVVLVFWRDIVYLIRHPFSKEMGFIVIATIPTVIIALLIEHFVSEFWMMTILGFGFLISAIVLVLTSVLNKRAHGDGGELTRGKAGLIGLVQGLAVFPGISRSGSTISAALIMGVERERAARFSFLISLPTIIGATIFELAGGIKNGFGDIDIWFCVVGFISAFIVAILSVKLMMKIVKKGKLWPFSIYLFILAALVLLNQFVFNIV